MKREISLLIVLAGLLFSVSFISAITGSMGNAKMILYPEVNGWTYTTIEKSILVKNVNDVPINIKLEVDEAGQEFIELIDTEFTLQPNNNKKANFLVKVKKEDTYEGRINVFFSPSDPKSKEPGVVLSSTVIVIAKKDQDYQDVPDEDSEDEEENDGVDVMTGGTIGASDKKPNKVLIVFVSTTLILIIALGVLGYFYNQKLLSKKTKSNSKKNVKKGGKVNAKKSVEKV